MTGAAGLVLGSPRVQRSEGVDVAHATGTQHVDCSFREHGIPGRTEVGAPSSRVLPTASGHAAPVPSCSAFTPQPPTMDGLGP